MNDFRLVHFCVSIPAILILIASFFRYQKLQKSHDNPDKRGRGLIWVIMSLGLWAVMSLLKSKELHIFKDGEGTDIELIGSLGSTILLLCAFPYFKHRFKFFDDERNRTNWRVSLVIVFIFSVILTIILCKQAKEYSEIPDCFLSIVTLLPLGILLEKNFKKREFQLIGIMSWITIAMLLACQILLFCDMLGTIDKWIIESFSFKISYISSFASLTTIFVALSFSSIVEETLASSKEKVDEANQKVRQVEADMSAKYQGRYWKDKIAVNQIHEVFDFLLPYSADRSPSINSDLIILSRSWHELGQDLIGIITDEAKSVKYVRISASLLKIIDTLFEEPKK